MARSFQIVEDKISETEFFLKKIRSAGLHLDQVRYYFSAYLSSARSVTFSLQCSLGDDPNFSDWYSSIQKNLRNDEIAQFMLKARNESQKQGISHITGGAFYKDKRGRKKILHFFDQIGPTMRNDSVLVPEKDAASVAYRHFVTLLKIVHECFQKFGSVIDPARYYTLENLQKIGKCIEDIEEELGYPRGWTTGIPDEERIRLLREGVPHPAIDVLFIKYLGMDRFCNKGESLKPRLF